MIIHPKVAQALESGEAVVALESTIVAHGVRLFLYPPLLFPFLS
jgi:pseudouridine-5'-phosphate glycosidase